MTEIEQAISILSETYRIAFEPNVSDETRKYNDTLDLALAALREKAERSKGCAYCNGEIKAADSAFGLYEHDGEWRISTDEYDTLIHFCPMCGRKLTKEAQA